MKDKNIPPYAPLTILFTVIVFCIFATTMIIVGGATFVLVKAGVLEELSLLNMKLPVAALAFSSILIGTIITIITSHIPLKPINILIRGMNRLAAGNYETRINLGNYKIAKEIANSFNTLADELKNTEMFRSDFVNNFSHEFKTPIVSIRGFAKLLKKGNLTEEQQLEYLDIIVDESSRLADMAANVLNLTKVENQYILTEITNFNLSEQLRHCVLLFEKKWSQKNLTIIADFDEYYINANEELLKQVWINLIDNSVKFSYDNGEISITITQSSDNITVCIRNNGEKICDDDINRIFNKFYQGDTSHSLQGTGIGLAIVKRIIDLHKGNISVVSSQEKTIFSVELPR